MPFSRSANMPFSSTSPVSFRRVNSWPMMSTAGGNDLIAVRVVVVKMRVDEEADRLVGDRLQLLQHRAPRFRRDVRIDNHHLVLVDDHRGIRADVHRAGADARCTRRDDLRELEGAAGPAVCAWNTAAEARGAASAAARRIRVISTVCLSGPQEILPLFVRCGRKTGTTFFADHDRFSRFQISSALRPAASVVTTRRRPDRV